MTKIIAVCNERGGVGKTTTTIQLAYVIAEMGKRVLVVDIDTQTSLTTYFSTFGVKNPVDLSVSPAGSYALFDAEYPIVPVNTGPARVGEKTFYEGQIDLLPAVKEPLQTVEQAVDANVPLTTAMQRFKELKELGYDYIVCDCPPGYSVRQIATVLASDHVVVPFKVDAFSAEGLVQMNEIVSLAQSLREDGLPLLHVVGNDISLNTKELKADWDYCKSELGGYLLKNYIPRTNIITNAVAAGRPIFKYPPHGHAGAVAHKYKNMAVELFERWGEKLEVFK